MGKLRLLSTKATTDLDLVFRDENLEYFRSKHMQVKRNDKHFRFNFTCNNKVTKRKREKFAWRKKDLKLQLECSEEWRVPAAQEALDLNRGKWRERGSNRALSSLSLVTICKAIKPQTKRDEI